jgi:2-polyprenyl-3-methyl-5-hydroxy-6-metoxy-1,4-benzoquinol methylase
MKWNLPARGGDPFDGAPFELPSDPAARLEAARWAYRMILLREPEAPAALEALAAAGSAHEMRNVLLSSSEVRAQKSLPVHHAFEGSEPPQEVQVDVSDAERERLFAMVQKVWRSLGEEKPHWSVLSSDEFLPGEVEKRMDAFYATGPVNVQWVLKALARNGVDAARHPVCMDYGCGVGRLSAALAPHFSRVVGVDVSERHLELAREALSSRGVVNVELRHVASIEAVRELPQADLVVSLIVLQHNPPPVMREILRALLGRLRPGGVALIQFPTYMPQPYRFRLKEYLAGGGRNMEMHALPQRDVFALAFALGIEVLEVFEDGWAGFGPGARSNTFVLRRPA